jgi:ribosome-associated protein
LSRTEPFTVVQQAACFLDDKLAKDIVVLDTHDISSLADYFIIASADSVTQVRALSAGLRHVLAQYDCLGTEADSQNRWHLLDFGDVIIHVMHHTERAFYQLDTFWNHATPVPAAQWQLRQAS